jgi:hypothetical protein
MIEELEDLIEEFPGDANRTRCFAHIINLVAKTAIRQFDTPKAKADEALDAAEAELQRLAEGEDLEDEETLNELRKKEREDKEGESQDDDTDGWVDEMDELDEVEREELRENIRPVRLVLVKVSEVQKYDIQRLTGPSCAKLRFLSSTLVPFSCQHGWSSKKSATRRLRLVRCLVMCRRGGIQPMIC